MSRESDKGASQSDAEKPVLSSGSLRDTFQITYSQTSQTVMLIHPPFLLIDLLTLLAIKPMTNDKPPNTDNI